MNIDEAFPSKFLKASDLQGKKVTLTMADVKTEEVGKEREHKAILYFKGTDKGIVLNKTNARKISEAYGADTDGWFGQKVELYEAQVEFSGKTVPAIRVGIPSGAPTQKAFAAKAQAPIAKPGPAANFGGELDDDIPF